MPTIQFATGQKVNFNGTPTPQDVDEVAKQLGIGGDNKVQFKEQPTETMNVGSIAGQPVVGGLAGSLIKDPVGTLKTIGKGFVSSEVSAGQDIAATMDQTRTDVQQGQSAAQDAKGQANNLFEQLLSKRHALAVAGQDTHNLDSVIADEAKTLGIANYEDIIPSAASKSDTQILGDFAGVALDATTAGTFAPEAKTGELFTKADQIAAKAAQATADTSKTVSTGQKLATVARKGAVASAKGAAVGYGYDVSQNLQGGKTGADALAPGMGTLVGAAIPAAFSLYNAGKITARSLAPRIDNSLIKPLPKQFRYGANPGRTMSEMGVTGNSWDDLASNITTARNTVGRQLSTIGSQLQEKAAGSTMDLTSTLAPLDEAITTAAENNNEALMKRLQNTKTAITDHLAPKVEDGTVIGIESKGKRNLAAATFQEATNTKRMIGKITQFTGNPSDDKAVNLALKNVYGAINATSQEFAKGVDEGLATDWTKANQRYADLQTAEIATQHRQELTQSKNLVSMPIKVGGAAGIITALATGGAAIPAVLVTMSAAALDKAAESPAVKTRLAAWLASESPGTLSKLYEQNPAIRSSLIKITKGSSSGS